jgi:hypothetical protein
VRYKENRCCRSEMEDRSGREEKGLPLEEAAVLCRDCGVLSKVSECTKASTDDNGNG